MNNFKTVNTQQAGIIYNYINTIVKLLKTNLAILFSRMCNINHITPKYIHVTVNSNNPGSINTKQAAKWNRHGQELKFLHNKKTQA